MTRKTYVIGGIVVSLAAGALLYNGMRSGSVYYYTVDELQAMEESLRGKVVRVSGQVEEGSVVWEGKTMTLGFALAGEGKSLAVAYSGVVPDAFRAGADVVVQGSYSPDGEFLADSILTKCPSKYVPKP